jgi:hypothetical protein
MLKPVTYMVQHNSKSFMVWVIVAALTVLLVAIVVIAQAHRSGKSHAFTQQHMNSQDYTIISAQAATAQGVQLDKGEVLYDPSPEEVQKGEELLREKFPNLDDYYRQYYATVSTVDGSKMLYVHAIAKDTGADFPDWRTYLYVVFDGGDSFLSGTINLTTGLVLAQYNGEI